MPAATAPEQQEVISPVSRWQLAPDQDRDGADPTASFLGERRSCFARRGWVVVLRQRHDVRIRARRPSLPGAAHGVFDGERPGGPRLKIGLRPSVTPDVSATPWPLSARPVPMIPLTRAEAMAASAAPALGPASVDWRRGGRDGEHLADGLGARPREGA
jgi:hypothetical protein